MDFSTPKIEQSKPNVLGISGFVISILSFLFGWFPIFGWLLWIVGLGLSIAGAFKTPRGLAVAGIIISVITIALYIILTIMVLNFFDGDVERLIREVEAWVRTKNLEMKTASEKMLFFCDFKSSY